jgi:hypothetical protein
MIDWIIENFPDEELLVADRFDSAIIGIDETSMRIIYSTSKCIEILEENMSREEAIEFFYYNVKGSYVGEKTPIWCLDSESI